MLAVSRRKIAAIAVACGLLAMFPAVTQAQPPADDKGLTTALRAGGLVILVRHGATFADQADTDPFNFDNISAQRNLNDSGKALARAFGEALVKPKFRSERSIPASSTEPTKPRRLPVLQTSRRLPI